LKKVLVTSALPYANGKIHLGHLAGAYLPADIYVRWLRLKGEAVLYVCGSDEYGVPITLAALKRGCTPKEIVDEFHKANGEAFAAAGVGFDVYGRTSAPEHHTVTQEFFTRLLKAGHVDRREIKQLYSEQSKMFLPDRYVEGTCPLCGHHDARGDQCDNCGGTYEVTELKDPRCALPGDNSTPVLKPTLHWFLKLENFQKRLEDFLASHGQGTPNPWRANSRRGAEGWLKAGLRARCITRDTTWGVKIPLDDPATAGKSLYVWFDAPIGYITFTQQLFASQGNPEGWKEYWQNPDCPIIHFIGKDNIPFHCITFPAMLAGVNDTPVPGQRGYQLPTQVVANEFLNYGADKFSKSRGNLIEVDWFAARYGSEPLRYYLTAVAPENNDSVFTWEDFMQRYNGELADILGNFVHRVMTFAVNKLGGKVPDPGELGPHKAFLDETAAALSTTGALLDGFQFRNGLATVLNCARAGNVYFDTNAPWKSLKTDASECNRVIYACLGRVAALGLLLRPFLPKSSNAILKYFGVSDPFAPGSASLRPEEIAKPGQPLGKPEVLFKKLEPKDLPGERQ